MTYGKRPPLDEQKSLWESTVAREGVTTLAGAAAGTSIYDAGLVGAGANSFVSMLMVLYPGQPLLVDSHDITAFDTVTGEVTYAGAYKGVAAAIPAGVPYKIVTFRFVPAEVAALAAALAAHEAAQLASRGEVTSIETKVDAVEVKLDTPANFMADVSALALEATVAKTTELISGAAVDFGAAAKASIQAAAAAAMTADAEIDAIKTETDQLPNVQHETEWASTPTIQALANAAATALTAGSITPTYPAGATRTRAILLATIHVANKTAAAHHISFKVEGQKAAGGYVNQLDLSAQEGLSMVDVDGATDGWSGAIDVTALVDTSAVAYDFRFEVDSDNAGNVIYICSFVLALVYTM